jgi:hypothetical protein
MKIEKMDAILARASAKHSKSKINQENLNMNLAINVDE